MRAGVVTMLITFLILYLITSLVITPIYWGSTAAEEPSKNDGRRS